MSALLWSVSEDLFDPGGKIRDNRFRRLVRNMLTTGYLADWTWNATLSGVPQGGITSPQ
jgi:hypothetical protein